MQRAGLTRRRVLLIWGVTALLLASAVVAGQVLLGGATPGALAVPQAFAGGAVLASLATTLMPEAYRDGGSWVGLATAVGFLVSFALSTS
jgi:ZIP family zinc transporter